jgi:hypothetical protein
VKMSADVNSRKNKKGIITKDINLVKRFIAEDDESSLDGCVSHLKKTFSEFENLHNKIHADIKEESAEAASDAYFAEVQDKYIAALEDAKAWLKSQDVHTSVESSEDDDSKNMHELIALMNLPKVELEVFNGDPLKYHSFMATFEEVVLKATKDGSSRLTRLLQYTSGKAKEAIRSCALLGGSSGYAQARDILERRFGNDHLVMQGIISDIRHGKQIRSAEGLQQLSDELNCAYATLSKMGKLHEVDSQTCIVEVVNRLQNFLKIRWRRRAMDMKRDHGAYPSFQDLVKFITQEAEEANDPVYGNLIGNKDQSKKTASSMSTNVKSLNFSQCLLCDQSHKLFQCQAFKELKPFERLKFVKENKLCENCLYSNHKVEDCKRPTVCTVPGCGKKHTRFIHVFQDSKESSTNVNDQSKNEIVANANVNVTSNVHVPVVPVRVNSHVETFALLDSASTSSFCTKSLVNKLRLKGEQHSFVLNTLSKSDEARVSEVVDLKLRSTDGKEYLNMKGVFVVDSIPVKSPNVSMSEYPHLCDLDIAMVGSENAINLLIGQDNAEALVPLGVRKGKKGDPFAIRTLFGWSLYGPALTNGPVSKRVVSHFITTSPIEDKVNDLWRLENEGLYCEPAWSLDDTKVVNLWDSEVTLVDGHYSLPIPWKENVVIPNNVSVARSRLDSLNASLHRKGLFYQYDSEIKKLLDAGYAEKVDYPDVQLCEGVWYLPHHAVISDKKPGKLRVVYDCASKFQGESLNDKCMQGPDLCNKLLYVLLRFRQHEYAMMADIEAMYYQVLVPIKDRDALRFMWYDQEGSIMHYRMTRHVFGGVWCSSAATYALRRTLLDNQKFDSLVIDTIRNDFYVDDCLKSVETKKELQTVVYGCKSLLDRGGFKLSKFVSNDFDSLKHLSLNDMEKGFDGQIPKSESKALGIRWNVGSDEFYFDVELEHKKFVTRRLMLSIVSSIFDPLGLISPVLIQGKILFQDATRLKLTWDQVLPAELISKWFSWFLSLSNLKLVRIPRCIKPMLFNDSFLEIHHFSDASERAYGSCAYLRCINKEGQVCSNLIVAKGKVAPINTISIPRLELQAAVLSVQMDTVLRREMDIDISKSYFWVDSQIVLKYIQNESRRFQVFVANRVGKIRQETSPDQWHHVSGNENPADLISRGQTPSMLDCNLWFHGPKFLSAYKSEWEILDVDNDIPPDDPEVKKEKYHTVMLDQQDCKVSACVGSVDNHPIDELINHYSNFYRMKRAFCWLKRLKEILQGNRENLGKHLTVQEMKNAEIAIFRHAQGQIFEKEINKVSKGENVGRSSPLKEFNPVLNSDGILCVGGRIAHVSMNESQKHPWILSHKHPLACTIVQEFHSKNHLGTEWTLNLLRKQFWITRARVLIKRVSRNCVTCKRLFAKPAMQKMADLPPERLQPDKPPFTFVGLDCFGPFMVKQARSEVKRYGCIFTCLTTRAVHIEKLNSLDTDSFLNGLRRFVARRGTPDKFWSDNGTNFVGGLSELKKSMADCKIKNYCLKQDIEWNFNPPGASHMGGIWERMIRTIRKVLGVLLNGARLTDEILETLFCEVECIVNSRPITKVSDDARDISALTPNHLLLLREGPVAPAGVFESVSMYRRRWKYIQYLADQFWRKWLKEYIPELQRRQKWFDVKTNVKIGDLVLIVDENTPRNLWPLGIVDEVKFGRDSLVRSVRVRTRSTVLVRPVTKIVLLEIS